jgi:hypothetical protein
MLPESRRDFPIYEGSITWSLCNQNMTDIIRKECYKKVIHMNIEAKILNQALANQIP